MPLKRKSKTSIRKIKCKSCGNRFERTNSLQKACSLSCALSLARISRLKKERQESLKRKRELKPTRKLVQEAQAVFNKWIKLRDYKLPCISCGIHESLQWDAGHYMPTSTHPNLRFNEDNVHKQCSQCNKYWSGNLVEYRKTLINRIGLDKVEQLERNKELKKYERDFLKNLKKEYSAKVRELKHN